MRTTTCPRRRRWFHGLHGTRPTCLLRYPTGWWSPTPRRSRSTASTGPATRRPGSRSRWCAPRPRSRCRSRSAGRPSTASRSCRGGPAAVSPAAPRPWTRGIVVSLERMRAIEIDTECRVAVVEPGAFNAEVKAAAAEHGLWYPPDPSSYEICSIGGNVATNAGGLCCVKYGVTTDYVLGLDVVLADGTLVTLGGKRIKDVAGLSLLKLFVGSEGTLGIVTRAILRLVPAQAARSTVVASFQHLGALGLPEQSRVVEDRGEVGDRRLIGDEGGCRRGARLVGRDVGDLQGLCRRVRERAQRGGDCRGGPERRRDGRAQGDAGALCGAVDGHEERRALCLAEGERRGRPWRRRDARLGAPRHRGRSRAEALRRSPSRRRARGLRRRLPRAGTVVPSAPATVVSEGTSVRPRWSSTVSPPRARHDIRSPLCPCRARTRPARACPMPRRVAVSG